ncbi:MAG TPA: hypothetical protein VD837_19540, partial [Terriglobales bacterium]|nr:hypothetical protein [Terriglobales bacterium]
GRSIGLYTPPAARIGVVQRTSLSTLKSCKNTEPTPKKGGFVSSLSPARAGLVHFSSSSFNCLTAIASSTH